MWQEVKDNKTDLPLCWTQFDFFWKKKNLIENYKHRSSVTLLTHFLCSLLFQKQKTVVGKTTLETYRSLSLKAWLAETLKFLSVPMQVKHQCGCEERENEHKATHCENLRRSTLLFCWQQYPKVGSEVIGKIRNREPLHRKHWLADWPKMLLYPEGNIWMTSLSPY